MMTSDDIRELLRRFMELDGERMDPVLRFCLAMQAYLQDKRDEQKEATTMIDDDELNRFFASLSTDEELKAFFRELEAEAEEFTREIASWPKLDLSELLGD